MTRTLIYAMQSSGASVYAFEKGKMCADVARTVLCIPDLWNHCLAPELVGIEAHDIILKVVVTNKFTLDQHINSFNPTEVILFRCDRQKNINSLSGKSYANESGDMAFKFSLFDSEIARNRFPVIHSTHCWVDIKPSDVNTMMLNNFHLSKWASGEYQKSWGFGGLHTTELI